MKFRQSTVAIFAIASVVLLGAVSYSPVDAASSSMGPTSSADQTAQLYIGASGLTSFTNQVFRYEVGTTGSPSLDLTLTDSSFARPCCMAFSPAGEMFVVSVGAGVSRFLDPQGTPLFNGTIASSGTHFAAFRDNELFVANTGGGNVLRFIFDPTGSAVPNGKITADLNTHLRGVQVNPATGELFVSLCCSSSRIERYVFDVDGNAMHNGSINGGGLGNPHDMAFSPWGELFVANHGNQSISRFVFDSAGNATFNGQIMGSSLNGPIGLDFSPWGELFVANHNGAGGVSRWVFDASFDATFNGSFPTPGPLGDLQFAPSTQQVEIDIKPGSFPNSINVGSNGKVPVAILSSPDFDATQVDPLSITLASGGVWLKGNGTPMASFSDVNGDGLTDIVVHVATDSLLLTNTDTNAVLEGETFDGIAFTGTDTIRIVSHD